MACLSAVSHQATMFGEALPKSAVKGFGYQLINSFNTFHHFNNMQLEALSLI